MATWIADPASRDGDLRAGGPVLLVLCCLSVVVRVATSLAWPNVIAPDETFQYLEPAYRLLTGRRLVAWEYVVGARSWLLPGATAGVMAAGRALSPAPEVYLAVVADGLTGLWVFGVVAAFRLGERAGGPLAAIFAGLLVAIWPEIVCLSTHVLADTVSGLLLICALGLAYRVERPSRGRLAAAGLLFGLAFVARLQLAPAIGLAMAWICGRDLWRRYLPMGLGFALAVLLLGAVDWVTWGAPFHSAWTYVVAQLGGVESNGGAPLIYYPVVELVAWGPAAFLVVLTFVSGVGKLPLPGAVALVVFATFEAFGYKEYRYLFPALPLVFVVCGVGTAQALGVLNVRPGVRLAIGAAAWVVACGVCASSGPMRALWSREAGMLQAMRTLNADPATCGVGVAPGNWTRTGQVRLRRDLTLYAAGPRAPTGETAAYDALLATPGDGLDALAARGGFRSAGCFDGGGRVCVYRRPGPCAGGRAAPLQAAPPEALRLTLARLGLKRAP